MPIAATVKGNGRVRTTKVLAARDMATEGCRAAALDRGHHLHLRMADVAPVGVTPAKAVIAEDIRDLQSRTRHACRRLQRAALLTAERRQLIERAQHITQHFAGDVGVAGCGIQLRMAQSHLNHANVRALLQKMRRK